MNTGRRNFNQLSQELKAGLQEAYFQSMITARLEPLVNFYEKNEEELSKEYHISLNNILNIQQSDLDRIGEMGLPEYENHVNLNTNEQGANNKALLNEEQKDIAERTVLPVIGIAAVTYGFYLILKSLRK